MSIENKFLYKLLDTKDWDFIIKYPKAIQWLYIEDLIPKKGDKK